MEQIDLPDEFYELFIVDPSNKPLGSASVSKVLKSRRDTKLNEILEENPKFVKASMDQEEVALFFEQYSLVSAGVVDDQNRLIGRITADDIVWVVQEEAEEDILRLGGVSESEMNQSIGRSTRRRFIWLFLNLLTAILASYVISLFDASIEKMVALAILMPIVASMGGNAGTQTLTLTVRAIATKELVDNNRRKVFLKEIAISILTLLKIYGIRKPNKPADKIFITIAAPTIIDKLRSENQIQAANPVIIANNIPFNTDIAISLKNTFLLLLSTSSLVAIALTVSVNVCVPALPPIDATIGIKIANATIFSILASNRLIT